MNGRRLTEEKLMNEKKMKKNMNNKHYIVLNYTHFSMLNWLKRLKYSDKFKLYVIVLK